MSYPRLILLIAALAALIVGLLPATVSADGDPYGGNDPFDSTESVELTGELLFARFGDPGPFGTDPTAIKGTLEQVCGKNDANKGRLGRVELVKFFDEWNGVPRVGGFACREIKITNPRNDWQKKWCKGRWYQSFSECWSTHAAGRAIDVSTCSGNGCTLNQPEPILNQALGDEIANWLLAKEHGEPAHNARLMGVMQILWHDRCWTASRPADQSVTSVSEMRYGCIDRHDNHLHLTLTSAAADGQSKWFDGSIPPPTRTTWQDGTPASATAAMARAVELGLFEADVRGDETLQRHSVAAALDGLELLHGEPQPASGQWTTGTPAANQEAMGRMVSIGYWSATWAGSDDVQRYELATIFSRAGFLAGQPVASPGTWQDGIPSWANSVMGSAVSAGLFPANESGATDAPRYELAVALETLNLLGAWRDGTPMWGIEATYNAVRHGLLSAGIPGSDVIERDEAAVLLDRLGLLTAPANAAAGPWQTGTRSWAQASMSRAVAQGIWSSQVAGSDTVTRVELAVVLDRLGLLSGQPVAAGGTWEAGTPSWGRSAMGRAVSAGVFSASVRGDDPVNRYDFAVVVDDRLNLL